MNFITTLCLRFLVYKTEKILLLCKVVVKIKWVDIRTKNSPGTGLLHNGLVTIVDIAVVSCCRALSVAYSEPWWIRDLETGAKPGRDGPVGCVCLPISEKQACQPAT